MLLEQSHVIREATPWPQHPAAVPQSQTQEHGRSPRTLETLLLGKLEHLALLTPRNPPSVVPTLREAEHAANISDLDVDQQMFGKSAGADSVPEVPLSDVRVRNPPLPE